LPLIMSRVWLRAGTGKSNAVNAARKIKHGKTGESDAHTFFMERVWLLRRH